MTRRKKENINTVTVQDTAVRVLSHDNNDYISLTDMARAFGGEDVIRNWMRSRATLEFLGTWEVIHNPEFKPVEFDRFKNEAGANTFTMTPKKWVDTTAATGAAQ